jgi:hypothetical protein
MTSRTLKEKEYAKVYMRCQYDASKELISRHAEEYKKILQQKHLEKGILPRNLKSKYKDVLIEKILKESGEMQ